MINYVDISIDNVKKVIYELTGKSCYKKSFVNINGNIQDSYRLINTNALISFRVNNKGVVAMVSYRNKLYLPSEFVKQFALD